MKYTVSSNRNLLRRHSKAFKRNCKSLRNLAFTLIWQKPTIPFPGKVTRSSRTEARQHNVEQIVTQQNTHIYNRLYAPSQGAPQGSVISPLVFNIYFGAVISDLKKIPDLTTVFFHADGTARPRNLKYGDIKKVLADNGFKINDNKCVLFCKRYSRLVPLRKTFV